MDDNNRSGWRKYAVGGALVAGGLLAGAVLAATASANAADSTTTPGGSQSNSGAAAYSPQSPGQGPGDRDETKSVRPDEHLLSGETADKVRAAALAKYPGATIQRVETDSDGVYEAHLVTAAGARVTVEVNNAFAVTGTEQPGQPGPH